MKQYKILSFFLAFALFFLASCDPNNTGTVNNNVSGNWRVSLFSERGVDETADFNGYTFSFNTGGQVVATKNGVSKNGTWSIDASSNKFIIDLGPKDNTNKPLGELTDDWQIQTITDNKISLKDDNASSNEILEFTKL
jgi:hypothetical protein